MITIAWLVTHAVIGAMRTIPAIFLFFLKQKQRGMDVGRDYLFIYRGTGKDMVDALPLAFVAVSTANAMVVAGIPG